MHAFEEELKKRILIIDGAMGTMIQAERFGEDDFKGAGHSCAIHTDAPQKGNNDLLVLTQPETVKAIHRAYLEAGADIVATNTFLVGRSHRPEPHDPMTKPPSWATPISDAMASPTSYSSETSLSRNGVAARTNVL